jgi:hypothetical protein
VTGSPSEPYVDEFGAKWDSKIAFYGVGLKLTCPNGEYVSLLTGLGSQGMTYQVLPNVHPALPWPPYPNNIEYGERCGCDGCAGRLVGDTIAAILAEADEIQATMKVNQDTYPLRFLVSARDFIVREVQLTGYGIHHDPDTLTTPALARPGASSSATTHPSKTSNPSRYGRQWRSLGRSQSPIPRPWRGQ